MLEHIHPDDQKIAQERAEARQRGETVASLYQVTLVRKDGSTFPAEVNVTLIDFQGTACSLCYARDITDRVKQENRLEVLHRFTAQMASASDLDEVDRITYNALVRVLGLSRGSLGLVNGEVLTHEYRWNMKRTEVFSMPLDGPGITVRAVNSKKTVLIKDIREDKDYYQGGEDEESTLSELVVPFFVEDNVEGVINVENKEVNAFSANDVIIVEILAVHIGIAVERMRIRTEQKETQKRIFELLDQLQQLNEELERSNQDLESYTYVVSHDLKAPLRTIKSFGGFILEDDIEQLSLDSKEYLNRILNAATHMDELITDLLTLSRVGRKDTELGKVNLNEIVESIENDIIAILKEKNAVILKDDLPVIEGQATWLKQLFLNLITNGLKFNESPQPTIRIRVEQSEEIYQFIVNDNGIGISSEYFEKIFDLFERLHSNDQYEGTGAGLSICKRIVEGFGGRIWVESEAGVGSSFYFTIPKTNG
ncbi:GAF domain-containing protein [Candidatus Bathyarchaeota archaeon]|nr:GAF domain-containing protein [Candidatus Bathyarchaeota archaeon]